MNSLPNRPSRVVAFAIAALLLALGASTVDLAPAFAGVQSTFYASPTGTGSACSLSAPCSLTAARTAVRGVNSAMSGDIRVLLRGGTYTLSSPFALTESGTVHDSGSNGYVVSYEAFPGESPVLSGGTAVTGWTLFDATKNIYRAAVPASLETRQVYVNGVRAVRASGPEMPTGFTVTSTGFTKSGMSSWANKSDIEIVGRSNYIFQRCPVASISGSQITMQQPCFSNATHVYGWITVARVENAYELLDTGGEWYLNRGTDYLYYKPRAGETMSTASVVAATQASLLEVTGTATTKVHDIQFRGITFNHATWTGPNDDDGYSPELAGFRYVGAGAAAQNEPDNYQRVPGAVRLSNATDIRFERNQFARLGGVGIDVQNASQRVSIVGNRFSDISGTAVQVGGTAVQDHHPTNSAQRMLDNVVSNNSITNIGVEYEDGVGVFVGYADGTVVSHNDIAHVPYSGIIAGLGFGYKDVGGRDGYTTPTTAQNTRIEFNRVRDYMEKLIDGGGIYTETNQPNSTITGNYVSNQGAVFAGIYLDEESSDFVVTSNVVRSTPNWLLIQYNSSDNVVTGNWTDAATADNRGYNNTVANNPVVTGNFSAPQQAVMDFAGIESIYTDIVGDTRYSFSDIVGAGTAVDGLHDQIDFGSGVWLSDPSYAGFASNRYGYFATAGTSKSFTLPSNRVLRSLTLEGPGTYTVSDGVNPNRSGTLGGVGTPTVVTTGWTAPGPTVAVTISSGYNSVIDDIVVGRAIVASVYGFEGTTSAMTALRGVNGGIDFGRGEWLSDPSYAGYAATTYAYFASAGTSRTFRIPDGRHLEKITLEGTGTYSLSDGVNPTVSGSLAGVGTPVVVTTAWSASGAVVTVTLSTGYNSVIDNIRVSG